MDFVQRLPIRMGSVGLLATSHFGSFAGLVLGLMLAASSPPALAGLYKCKNAEGKVIYSDKPCSVQAIAPDNRPAKSDGIAGALTEKQIRGLIAEHDAAMKRLDADTALQLISDDARIEVYLRRAGATGRRTFRKDEFAVFMRNSFRDISGYAVRRESVHIAIAPNGLQGEANSHINEEWREDGQFLTMASDEQYLVELRAGKPRFVWIHVSATGEPRVKK
jgi:uncharacterized protein DUF4124